MHLDQLALAVAHIVLALPASTAQCPPPPSDKSITVFLSLLGIVGTLGAALGVSALSARTTRRERIAAEAREQRQAIYKRLVDMLRKGGLQRMNNLAEGADILIYAADEVVTAWGNMINFVVYEGGARDATPRTIELWGELLLAMRRDAGRPETKLTIDGTLRALGIDRTRNWKDLVATANTAEQDPPG